MMAVHPVEMAAMEGAAEVAMAAARQAMIDSIMSRQ